VRRRRRDGRRGRPSGCGRVESRRSLWGDDGDSRQGTRRHRPLRGADDRRRRQRHGRLGRRDGLGFRWSRIGDRGRRRGCRAGDGRARRRQLLDDRLRGCCGRRRPGGQQAERIDVAVGIGCDPDAEVDVRRLRDRIRALARDADGRSFLDHAAALDARRRQLQQRHRVAVRSLDRDRAAAARDRAAEGDRPGHGREHGASRLGGDVDAAMLPTGVRVRPERERPDDRTDSRPDPGASRRCGGERREQDQDREDAPHD